MPPSARGRRLSLARQLLLRSLLGRLPHVPCPMPLRWTGSVHVAPIRSNIRTLANMAAIYCRINSGRLRCGDAVPHNLSTATPLLSFPYRAAPPCSPSGRLGLVLKTPVAAVAVRSPIIQQPSPCPPPGLLPEPRRTKVSGLSSAHHKEVGGHPTYPAAIVGPLRTHDPRPL